MAWGGARAVLIALVVFVGVLEIGHAEAVEYRLQVASLHEEAFTHFLSLAHLKGGYAGPGLDRLEARLDQASLPAGAFLYDRPLEPVAPATARAFGAVHVRARSAEPVTEPQQWTEFRWDGKPGERSVWLVASSRPQVQELRHLGLKGRGPLRYLMPYYASNGSALPAVSMPLNFIQTWAETAGFWERHLARRVDLRDGIAVVIGSNHNSVFPDYVFIVIDQGPEPTTYKAVLGWQRRYGVDIGNLEGPGNDLAR